MEGADQLPKAGLTPDSELLETVVDTVAAVNTSGAEVVQLGCPNTDAVEAVEAGAETELSEAVPKIGLKVWTGGLLAVSVVDGVVDTLKMGLKPDDSRGVVLQAAAAVVVAVLDEAVVSRLKRPGAGAGCFSDAAVAGATTGVEAEVTRREEAGTVVFRDPLDSP